MAPADRVVMDVLHLPRPDRADETADRAFEIGALGESEGAESRRRGAAHARGAGPVGVIRAAPTTGRRRSSCGAPAC
jgi:hypothetical protein